MIAARANQHIDGTSKFCPGALDHHVQLIRIGDIRGNTQGAASGLFNLNMRQVDFGLTAADQDNVRAQPCEPQSEPLPYSAASAGDQNVLLLEFGLYAVATSTPTKG